MAATSNASDASYDARKRISLAEAQKVHRVRMTLDRTAVSRSHSGPIVQLHEPKRSMKEKYNG